MLLLGRLHCGCGLCAGTEWSAAGWAPRDAEVPPPTQRCAPGAGWAWSVRSVLKALVPLTYRRGAACLLFVCVCWFVILLSAFTGYCSCVCTRWSHCMTVSACSVGTYGVAHRGSRTKHGQLRGSVCVCLHHCALFCTICTALAPHPTWVACYRFLSTANAGSGSAG